MSESDVRDTGEVGEDLFAGMDPRVAEAVRGLTYLGKLEDTFHWCGHVFGLRTLKGKEELDAGKAIEEYAETVGAARAWSWAQVALALTTVDGKDDFCPRAGPDDTAHAKARFNYLTTEWYWPTCEALYSAFLDLRQLQLDAIEAMQNLSVGGRPTSFGSPDFLTDPVN